jgi:hypothetical protein
VVTNNTAFDEIDVVRDHFLDGDVIVG